MRHQGTSFWAISEVSVGDVTFNSRLESQEGVSHGEGSTGGIAFLLRKQLIKHPKVGPRLDVPRKKMSLFLQFSHFLNMSVLISCI